MRQACLKRKKAKGDGVPSAEMSEDRPGREHRVYTSLTVEEKMHKPRHSLGERGGWTGRVLWAPLWTSAFLISGKGSH